MQQAVRTGRIDLRKVAGEVNPADLFTKHSLSRERMSNLVSLFDCSFRGGRAESAPQTRAVGNERVTMAEADVHSHEMATVDHEIIFPHIKYTPRDLDRLYPTITAPEAMDADDPQNTEVDPILESGLRSAHDLVQAGLEQGRLRRLQ